MKDRRASLDEFLKMTGKEILNHSGTISHQQAIDKAKEEYKNIKSLQKMNYQKWNWISLNLLKQLKKY